MGRRDGVCKYPLGGFGGKGKAMEKNFCIFVFLNCIFVFVFSAGISVSSGNGKLWRGLGEDGERLPVRKFNSNRKICLCLFFYMFYPIFISHAGDSVHRNSIFYIV